MYFCIKEVFVENIGLNITPKEFKQLSKWAEEVYNIAVVVDYCLVVGIKRVYVFCFKELRSSRKSTSHSARSSLEP
jgi:hypothetical protein